MKNNELTEIIKKFADSGWDIIETPSKAWLEEDDENSRENLISAIRQADEECGSCGCEFDALYKRALVILED